MVDRTDSEATRTTSSWRGTFHRKLSTTLEMTFPEDGSPWTYVFSDEERADAESWLSRFWSKRYNEGKLTAKDRRNELRLRRRGGRRAVRVETIGHHRDRRPSDFNAGRRDEALGVELGVVEGDNYDRGRSAQRERASRMSAQLASRIAPAVTYLVVGDVAAHDGWVTSVLADDAWLPENPGGWTYQDVTGAHGTVLHEGADEAEAQRVLDEWLDCPAAREGRYCYTHNSSADR